MMEMYGQESFALLVDEGSEYCNARLMVNWSVVTARVGVYRDIEGTIIAIPGIAERGLCEYQGQGLDFRWPFKRSA